jgi:hypothetical protein
MAVAHNALAADVSFGQAAVTATAIVSPLQWRNYV